MCEGVEVWLPRLLSSIGSALLSLLADTLGCEDTPTNVPCQVSSLAIYLKWTTDAEEV